MGHHNHRMVTTLQAVTRLTLNRIAVATNHVRACMSRRDLKKNGVGRCHMDSLGRM